MSCQSIDKDSIIFSLISTKHFGIVKVIPENIFKIIFGQDYLIFTSQNEITYANKTLSNYKVNMIYKEDILTKVNKKNYAERKIL